MVMVARWLHVVRYCERRDVLWPSPVSVRH